MCVKAVRMPFYAGCDCTYMCVKACICHSTYADCDCIYIYIYIYVCIKVMRMPFYAGCDGQIYGHACKCWCKPHLSFKQAQLDVTIHAYCVLKPGVCHSKLIVIVHV